MNVRRNVRRQVLWLLPLALIALPLMADDPVGLTVSSIGNVGIGTDDPEAPLHVSGDALISGVIGGAGYEGRYGQSSVLQGWSPIGTESLFTIVYDDLNNPNSPNAIQITNVATNVFKTFIIDHPSDPGRYLVHATLEGPEGAVFYRGSARLRDGRAEVELPAYFEALTAREGRTVLLTNIDGFDRLAVKTVRNEKIYGGRFIVYSDNPSSAQPFDWEVKAVRADKAPLETEPAVDQIDVHGFGPYTYALVP